MLVTRPANQAGPFMQSLEQAGFRALSMPSIEITDVDDPQPALERVARLADYQLLIFISTNAVDWGLKFLQRQGVSIRQPVAAIGSSTAARLAQHGIEVALQPLSDFNTEALLALDAMQAQHLSGQRVLIFRGQGGREQLADSLRERGADVDYAEVYQRRRPTAGDDTVMRQWHNGDIHLVTVTSNQALENLYHMLDIKERPLLLSTALVVPGQRCAQLAQQLGFTGQILIADNATDDAMLASVRQWKQR